MLLDTPLCDFGWQAADFTLKDPSGRSFNMKKQLGEKGLLIAFICNHCPYVQAIGERLAQDSNELMAEGINVLAVMSNDYRHVPADSPENMLRFANQYGFKFPYLIDEDQSVGKAYGAVCTPDFFGFNKDGGLQYRGRLDNANMKNTLDRSKELVNAMAKSPLRVMALFDKQHQWAALSSGINKIKSLVSRQPILIKLTAY